MTRTLLSLLTASALGAAALAMPAAALAGVTVTITGNQARADIVLPGVPGNPHYTGTLVLEFDSPLGLTAANLNVTAQVVDPGDPALRARLSGGALVQVPSAFPVMVSVRPRGGLEFRNAVRVELYTSEYSYAAGSPFRLYKAPAGGTFFDLTEDVLAGSIRCRGRTGSFSDFLMVSDARTAREAAEDKFEFLDARVDDDDIAPAVRAQLQLDLDEAWEEFLEGDYEDARAELDDLELRVDAAAGVTVPNLWVAGDDLDNVAGSLEAEAASLDFQLRRLAAAGGGGGDDDD